MLLENTIKKTLASGRPVIGTWNTLASPLVTEVLAQAGLDFQIIDLEHGPFVIEQVCLHVSACEGSRACTPLVRIPANESWMALQALDQGAHGLVVPHIEDRESARILVDSTKYYQIGNRGYTPFSKAGGFTNQNSTRYVERAISETLNVVIIESQEGLKNLDSIIDVQGIDVIYFGAYDLSQVLGYPGDAWHPEVIAKIQDGVERVNKSGKYAGGFVPQSKDDIRRLLDMGMSFITYEVDSSIIYTHLKEISGWFLENTRK